MISQHLQTTTQSVSLSKSNQYSGEGTTLDAVSGTQQQYTIFPEEVDIVGTAIAELQNFIAQHPDAREVRKALAVKLIYQGYFYDEIQAILDVSRGSITGWKQDYEQDGIDGLRLNYKGRKSYLSSEQREDVLNWLQTKEYWEISELENKLASEYNIVYESKQSYYDLFEAAGISWKKTTKHNPKANPDAVAEKKKEIEALLAKHRFEIETGKLRVFLIDNTFAKIKRAFCSRVMFSRLQLKHP